MKPQYAKIMNEIAPGKKTSEMTSEQLDEFIRRLDALPENDEEQAAHFKEKRIAMLRQAGHDTEAESLKTTPTAERRVYFAHATALSQRLFAEHDDSEMPITEEDNGVIDPREIRTAKLSLREHGIVALSNEAFAHFLTNPAVDGTLIAGNETDIATEASLDIRLGSYHTAALRYFYSYGSMAIMWLFTLICVAVYCAEAPKPDGNNDREYFLSFLFFAVPSFLFNTICLCLIRITAELTLLKNTNWFSLSVIKSGASDIARATVNMNLAIATFINKLLHGPLFFSWYIVSFVVINNLFLHDANWAMRLVLGFFGSVWLTIICVSFVTMVLNEWVNEIVSGITDDQLLRIRISSLNDKSLSCVYTPKRAVFSWRDAAELNRWMNMAQVRLEIMSNRTSAAEQREDEVRRSIAAAIAGTGKKISMVNDSCFV